MKRLRLFGILIFISATAFAEEQVDREILKNFEFFSQMKVAKNLAFLKKYEAVKLFQAQERGQGEGVDEKSKKVQ